MNRTPPEAGAPASCGSGAPPAGSTRPRACAARAPEAARAAAGVVQAEPLLLRRIAVALARRARYRYVSPAVRAIAGGFEVSSPNCSRSVAADGGVIPIARLLRDGDGWRLLGHDHRSGAWHDEGRRFQLDEALAVLNEDSRRRFWP